MKVRNMKHRVVVTPWVLYSRKKTRRVVRAPLSYWFARSVIPNI